MQAVLKSMSLALRIDNKGGVSSKLTRQLLTDFLEVFSVWLSESPWSSWAPMLSFQRPMRLCLGGDNSPKTKVHPKRRTPAIFEGRLHLNRKEPEKEKRPVGQLTNWFGSCLELFVLIKLMMNQESLVLGQDLEAELFDGRNACKSDLNNRTECAWREQSGCRDSVGMEAQLLQSLSICLSQPWARDD